MVSFKHLPSIIFVLLLGLIPATHGKVCSEPDTYAGKTVCDFDGDYCGECVSFVKRCTDDRRTTPNWERGEQVRGADIPYGTAIATFPGGSYRGHAAIYVKQDNSGIIVYDQWKDRPVGLRRIRWHGSYIANDGNSFYVID